MTEDDVRLLLRDKAGWKGAGDLAKRIGISKTYMSEVMNGKKAPNDTILSAMGLERRIVRVRKTWRLRPPQELV